MSKLMIPNRSVQIIGFTQGSVSSEIIKKDLMKIKALLENCKYNPKVDFSFKRDVLKVRCGNLYLDGHQIDKDKGRLIKVNLNYGYNVPRFCELLAYSCEYYTIYFLAVTDENVGDMEKYIVGTGVTWGSNLYWSLVG